MTRPALTKEPPPQSPLVGRVLIVDDHASARESMADILRHAGHQVQCVSSAVEALKQLSSEAFDVVVTDLQMPGMTGIELIRNLQRQSHGAQAIMVTAHATVATAVEAMRLGAFDYIEKPFRVEHLEGLVNRALEHRQQLDRHEPAIQPVSRESHCCLIGASAAMQQVRKRIDQIAPTSETVLILGESGTGKELLARTIHAASPRRNGPFVGLNCPALSEQLMESELFGHERGAFTGAEVRRTGRFELANGGTILLDEVTEIDIPLQSKLLRVLQERSFERVGSSTTIHVDVRVLATTNRDLQKLVNSGGFREDLFYRLAVIPLEVPPLRNRIDDVPELARHFLQRAAERLGRDICVLDESALQLLLDYHWPGNVRELENIVTRASVLNTGRPITADELQPWLIDSHGDHATTETDAVTVGVSLREMERKLIQMTLDHFSGHRAKTATALGIGIRTLSGKLREYGYAPRAKKLAA